MRVAVVGGGIAGLAAAHELADDAGVEIVVLEAAEQLGGKLQTEPFAGRPLDTGPDSFLARRPEAVALCDELGLGDRLVAPSERSAYIWTRGRLRRLPEGLVLGVPSDLTSVARSGILSPLGMARAAVEPLLPGAPLRGDAGVGEVMRRRLGDEAHARLVDPLLGGINAGDSDRLSIQAVAPQLAALARRDRSLVRAARAVLAGGPPSDEPVFLTHPDGLGTLVDALATRLRAAGVELCTGTAVSSLRAAADGRSHVLATSAGEVDADAVVLAVPAFAAAPLLAPAAPSAAAVLAGVEHASVTLVALAYPRDAVPRPLDGSGFLVPRVDGRLMTACSWSSSKWRHVGGGHQVVLRASTGRAGDTRHEGLDDEELVRQLTIELRESMGVRAAPLDVRVTRWPDAFPQYTPGHLERMDACRAEVAARLPGVALAGAMLGGVGIPACIGSGRAAARAAVAAASAAGPA